MKYSWIDEWVFPILNEKNTRKFEKKKIHNSKFLRDLNSKPNDQKSAAIIIILLMRL